MSHETYYPNYPTISAIETPPAPDEGHVQSVEVDYTHHSRTGPYRRKCQTCESTIYYDEPHVRAVVWVQVGKHKHMKKPIFCDRECWQEWASA